MVNIDNKVLLFIMCVCTSCIQAIIESYRKKENRNDFIYRLILTILIMTLVFVIVMMIGGMKNIK